MCGIAGFTTRLGIPESERHAAHGERLAAMVAALYHRGPDAQTGVLLDGVALGHSRLAILDLSGGGQPMSDPETGVTLVFNGEIFNHQELRDELRDAHRFRSRSDTEVLLAAWIRWGPACLDRLNGQWAFALWDPRERSLSLCRDRVGHLPLFVARGVHGLAFASEAKALVAAGFVAPRLDPRGVKQALQLWAPVPPRTCVAGVESIPPGHWARWADGALSVRRFWDVDLGHPEPDEPSPRADAARVEAFSALLDDAVRLRLRADVPVGAYLSGGIDSSYLCALAQARLGGTLRTWSIGFEDPRFDESRFQREVATALATHHHPVLARPTLVAELLPDAVRHGEQVLVRSAPAPLLALSRAVRDDRCKVVLTGEGADEVLLGYELFGESRIRAFWARQPGSRLRPALLSRLYPYLSFSSQGAEAVRASFGVGLDRVADPAFSHLVRWAAGSRLFRLLAPELERAAGDEDPAATAVAALPARVRGWTTLQRAQYLELTGLLPGYLLAAQGDRMLMAGSVEGRFPYLDHRVIEAAARMPLRLKLRALTGKWILRRAAQGRIPRAVLERGKFPYRAPAAALLDGSWAREALAAEEIRRVGLFDPDRAARLVAKAADARIPASEFDAMAVTALASGQLLVRALETAAPPAALRTRIAREVA